MKIAILGINNNINDTNKQESIINFIKFNINRIGEQVSLISYVNNNYDYIRNCLQDNFDIIFCVGSDSVIFNHNIKENLSRIIGKKLDKNLSIETCLKRYCESKFIEISTDEELMWLSPSDSIPLCDSEFYNNGFMYKYNNTHLIYLPAELCFVKSMYSSMVFPFIKDVVSNKLECVTLKCYGIFEKDIRNILADEIVNEKLNIKINSCRLDNTIFIRYSLQNTDFVQPIIAEICDKLSKFIYSTEDNSLYETAINLLKIQKKRITIAETLTFGNILFNLSKNDSDTLDQGRVFSNFDSLASSLKLESRIVSQFGKFSVNTVYELDNLLLQSSKADIAIVVLGDKQCDTCYIAIGDIDGIHVYKNKIYAFDDSLIEMLSDTTLFYLIKKLRQNDLQFR